jgi:hypothetical protein
LGGFKNIDIQAAQKDLRGEARDELILRLAQDRLSAGVLLNTSDCVKTQSEPLDAAQGERWRIEIIEISPFVVRLV